MTDVPVIIQPYQIALLDRKPILSLQTRRIDNRFVGFMGACLFVGSVYLHIYRPFCWYLTRGLPGPTESGIKSGPHRGPISLCTYIVYMYIDINVNAHACFPKTRN